MNSSSLFTQEEVAQRAHDIWEQCGRPEGQELAHWLQAERELRCEREQADRIRRGALGCVTAPEIHYHSH